MSHRILSISYDGPLLVTRQMLLQAYGYDVASAEGFAEALEIAESDPNSDLAISLLFGMSLKIKSPWSPNHTGPSAQTPPVQMRVRPVVPALYLPKRLRSPRAIRISTSSSWATPFR